MARILVIRISAIGDVAMTIPVIYSAARANPADTFSVVTQLFLKPIFINAPSNVEVIAINTKGREKDLSGLLKFSAVLARQNFDMVLDLHDVLRTKVIRTYFKAKGKRVEVFNKGRKDRARLTARNSKELIPLRPVIERYADVFRKAGLAYADSFTSLFQDIPADVALMEATVEVKKGKWIGIAPFAKHRGKIYPTDKMEEIIARLSAHEDVTVFLFGGRGAEEIVLDQLSHKYPNVKSVVGRYTLDTELVLISQLDVLLSMDSANMHFASLVNTPVVSIWGATHPYVGFYGYRQSLENSVQLSLACRPCSVFGNKECWKGTWECMNISPEIILKKIEQVWNKSK